MLNLDSISNENNKAHNQKWPYIPDCPYRVLIIGGSISGKTNALLNLIKEQNDIDKIYLFAHDLSESKYEFLIKKHEDAGIKHLNDSNAFIESPNTMDNVYDNIDDYNPTRRRKIDFDDMIADIISNKKIKAVVKELFIRCSKLNISLVFIPQSYFSVPKDVRLNSTHYLITKINNREELQNITITHYVDINHKYFMKIYREYTKEPYSFLTIDTTLLASDPLRFTKKFFSLIKMKVTDQIKILDKKIKQNEAQYELDRKVAKISALFPGNLDKYEYLTGEDLNYKPSTVEKAKFDYSSLSKFFIKGLKEEDKKEGLLKKLKNIEDKNEEQLKAIKNKAENVKEVTEFVEEPLIPEANVLINEIRSIQKDVNYKKLKCTGGNDFAYDFSDYRIFKELFKDIYYRNMSINGAERKQDEFDAVFNALSRYSPSDEKYIKAKNELLTNSKNFYKGREKLLKGLKMEYFYPLKKIFIVMVKDQICLQYLTQALMNPML